MHSEPILPRNTALRCLIFLASAALLTAFAAIVWALLDPSGSMVTRWVVATIGDPARPSNVPMFHVLLALPIGAVIVVAVRSLLGWGTFGVFTPMLLAFAFLQSGPIVGPTVSTAAILIGLAAAPALRLLGLSRIAYLGVLIAIVVAALGALAINFDRIEMVSAFPVVVTALVVERCWHALETEGPRKALTMIWTTHFVALVIHVLIASPLLIHFAKTAPLALPIASVMLMVLLGRYQGLRLSELTRFRPAKGN